MDENYDSDLRTSACSLSSIDKRGTFFLGALILSVLLGGFLAGA